MFEASSASWVPTPLIAPSSITMILSASCTLEIPDAALWSAEHPNLYEARVALLDGDGSVLDERTVRFGIRTLSWGVDGLFVFCDEEAWHVQSVLQSF